MGSWMGAKDHVSTDSTGTENWKSISPSVDSIKEALDWHNRVWILDARCGWRDGG